MPTSPYARYVGSLDAVDVLRTSFDGYRTVVPGLSAATWATPYAPGKWTARQIMVHVAQWEMILGMRVRFGLGVAGYTVQPIEQDDLMREGDVVDGPTAWGAFEGARRMNLAFAQSLSDADRRRTVTHPEFGEIDVEYMLVTLAGHGVHHYLQLASLSGAAT
ncbi:MAG TPA: DinB family protein [Vicinamibacterales bacterium]|nr:DinB family protein [Vicinamibacterales bacterium]